MRALGIELLNEGVKLSLSKLPTAFETTYSDVVRLVAGMAERYSSRYGKTRPYSRCTTNRSDPSHRITEYPRHGSRPHCPRHQSMTIQNRMNCARRRDFDRMRQASQKTLPNLTSSPVRLFPFCGNDRRLNLFRQLVGIAERSAGAIAQPFQPALLITLKDLVTGLPRNSKLPAKRSHALPIF